MVNLQDTPSAGQISAADLDAARKHSTGRIVHLRRATLLPAGCDQQGRHATRQWPAFPDTVPTDWHGLDACHLQGRGAAGGRIGGRPGRSPRRGEK